MKLGITRSRTLPIPLPLPAHRVRQRRSLRGLVQRLIRQPPPVRPPRHLDGIGRQVFAADVVVLVQFGAM